MRFFDFLKERFTIGNTLYYPGCLTKFSAPEIEKNYIRILNNIGLDFIQVPEFYCCGKPSTSAGYSDVTENIKDKNMEIFRKYGVKKIVTNCPSCYHEFLGYEGIIVEHVTQTLAKRLKKVRKSFQEGKITYKEPCYLGRKSGVFEEPRKILEHLGFEIIEQENNRERSFCCGAGGGLKTNYPEFSNRIAKKYFKGVKTDIVVTTCPLCYKQLKENSGNKTKVYELSQVLLNKVEEGL